MTPKLKRLQHRTLLIVDDDINLVEFLTAQITELGYATLTANNGKEALAILESDTVVHAVLCDIVMPEMTGIELLTNVRGRGLMVPFVFLTGFQSETTLRAAVRLGAFDFLSKPSTSNVLAETVERALEAGVRTIEANAALEALKRDVQHSKDAAALERANDQINRLRTLAKY